jgi:uridine kinase
MKIALLISGYLRTFKTTIFSIKETILNNNEVDIYMHITKNENEDIYMNNNDFNEMIILINMQLKPKCILIEKNGFFSEDIKTNDLYNQWLKYYKLNEIKKQNENIYNYKYDIVIKYRYDVIIEEELNFNEFNKNIIYIPFDSKIDKSKLTNKNDMFVCDILAYGDSNIMDKYFNIFFHLSEYIKLYGIISETILYYHLSKNNIKINFFYNKFNVILSECNLIAICGDSSSGKTTLSTKLQNIFSKAFIMECDRYHKWERNDKNWNTLTHLNPDANYLIKMKKDVFSLKIGQNIYQVDYNHKTGKFTSPEYIKNEKNIIVCGLHTLYNNNAIYNFKIFMDTDINLKYQWKIIRDTTKRGHSKKNIIENIKKRQDDYNKYILPQKYNSDLIVRFYNNNIFDLDSFDEIKIINKELHLMLSISNKYNIFDIIYVFQKYNINIIQQKILENYNTIVFEKYVQIKELFDEFINLKLNLENFLSNDFYEYILFIIMKLNSM